MTDAFGGVRINLRTLFHSNSCSSSCIALTQYTWTRTDLTVLSLILDINELNTQKSWRLDKRACFSLSWVRVRAPKNVWPRTWVRGWSLVHFVKGDSSNDIQDWFQHWLPQVSIAHHFVIYKILPLDNSIRSIILPWKWSSLIAFSPYTRSLLRILVSWKLLLSIVFGIEVKTSLLDQG